MQFVEYWLYLTKAHCILYVVIDANTSPIFLLLYVSQVAQASRTKRKHSVQSELDELMRKKVRLSQDVETLIRSADEIAEKAEGSRDIADLLTRSNALRRASKAKEAQLTEVRQLISEKESELRSSSQS